MKEHSKHIAIKDVFLEKALEHTDHLQFRQMSGWYVYLQCDKMDMNVWHGVILNSADETKKDLGDLKNISPQRNKKIKNKNRITIDGLKKLHVHF